MYNKIKMWGVNTVKKMHLKYKIKLAKFRIIAKLIILVSLIWIFNWLILMDLIKDTRTMVISNEMTVGKNEATLGTLTGNEESPVALGEGETPLATEIERDICETFGDKCKTAIAIAKAESRLNPNAIGDKHMTYWSYGLFQVNVGYNPKYNKDKLLESGYNIKAAKEIYDVFERSRGNGWLAWSTFKNNRYLEFM